MPFTFAHPAAILPFRRYCPSFLNFPALVVGSMTPDAGYYLHNWQWAVWGHSFAGSVTFDVVAGLAFLAVFYLSLRPVAALLPHPHRQTVLSWKPAARIPGVRAVLVAALSIVIGAWTHIVWDGFTHANGWCVRNFSPLTPTVFSIGSYHVSVWQLLQHASTIFGLYVLWSAYRLQTAKYPSSPGTTTERLAVLGVLALPAVFASIHSIGEFKSGINMFNLASFAYVAAVRYVDYVLPSLLCAGVIASVCRLFVRKAAKINVEPAPVVDSESTVVVAAASTGGSAAVSPPVVKQNVNVVVSGGESGQYTSVS
ncbi:MAG: DUF4184 family protein [Candidatus Obscuribacterales bacterium]|nr:DUF4184 family protein [Candidatus Obscuribacterales bacterium]